MLYSTALWSLLATIALASSWITPGATWLDTSGNPIDAHGLQVMQIGKRFYWIGHNRAGSATVYGGKYLRLVVHFPMSLILNRCHTDTLYVK